VNSQKPREIAVRLLGAPSTADFIENRLESELANSPMSPVDKRLTQELVFGIIRWRAALDWLIERKAKNRTQKAALANLLRLGLYQMFWLDRIPDHAAVNETVELARQFGFGPQAGFVNALLRGYTREKAATRQLLRDLKITAPALGYSQPDWLVTRWLNRWGAGDTSALLEWNNTPPKTFARVNTLRITPEKLLSIWQDEKVEYEMVKREWFADGLVFELKEHPPLPALDSFQKGYFYVQDPGTLLAVRMLDPQPGEYILDACAAPGGKTTYLAQLLNNQGRLMAQDTDPRRLVLLRENLTRLGVTCAATSRPSGTRYPELNARYDRVLVDAPCSNTGVMRRRVELRWRVQPREILRLEAAQIVLLRKVALAVKPRGWLVYSTCSLEIEENSRVVQKFLSEHPGWQLEQERELLPFKDGVDGAYVAVLRAPEQAVQPAPWSTTPLP
jgi:16S rRNA (cytosine967-C5)-methyltransferase